jgi:hypothetical protein
MHEVAQTGAVLHGLSSKPAAQCCAILRSTAQRGAFGLDAPLEQPPLLLRYNCHYYFTVHWYNHTLTHLPTIHVRVALLWRSVLFEQHHINESDQD